MPVATPEPYNSDPMDQPPPGWKYEPGATERWARETEVHVLSTPEPAFTWVGIMRAALDERKARFTDLAIQKNYELLNWYLDHPPEELPSDLLLITQGYSKNTHPLEVQND